jgi:hypothetical protein
VRPRLGSVVLALVALLGAAPSAGAATQVLTPTADAHVRADRPTTNFGTSGTLQLDGSPVLNGYLRFNLTLPPGETLTRATLRLFTNQSSSAGLTVHGVASSSWGETTITYRTAPAMGPSVATIGGYAASTWIAADVTALVGSGGSRTIGLRRASVTLNTYHPREAASATRPQLVVETADAAPPDTTITAGPAGATTDATPTFEFTATETPATFACRVDDAPFAPCTSPHTTAELADGAHAFEVAGRDAAGNLDPTPASRSFTVDTTTPQPTFPIRAAFYYPWFPEAWNQSGINPFTKYNPSLGFYSSAADSVRDAHLRSLEHGRFEAAIYSWWGQGSKEDVRFPGMLARTRATRSPVKWALYHEREGNGPDPSVAQLQSDLDHIKASYTADQGYLRVGGRPVLFVYGDAGDGCAMADRWYAANDATRDFFLVLKVFGGYRTCPNQPASWHQYAPAVRTDRQAGYAYVISPEFDLTGPDPPRLPRDLVAFQAAIRSMIAAGDPWQLVTTFNEWGENSATESAAEWASASGHGQYLDALRADGA